MNIEEKLNTEVDWLYNVNLQEEENCEEMQMLLAGHLKLVAALFTCDGINKQKYGQFFNSILFNRFKNWFIVCLVY